MFQLRWLEDTAPNRALLVNTDLLQPDPPAFPPPTVMSGYVDGTDLEVGMNPFEVLNQHEAKVRPWFKSLPLIDLTHQLIKAGKHRRFGAYPKTMRSSNKWGETDNHVDDLVAFDVWLKNLFLGDRRSAALSGPDPNQPPPPPPPAADTKEISEVKPGSKVATPATSTTGPTTMFAKTAPAKIAPATRAAPATASVDPTPAIEPVPLVQLTAEEQKACVGFWNQFRKPGASTPSTHTPTTPVTPVVGSPRDIGSTDLTPTVKRTLQFVSAGLL